MAGRLLATVLDHPDRLYDVAAGTHRGKIDAVLVAKRVVSEEMDVLPGNGGDFLQRFDRLLVAIAFVLLEQVREQHLVQRKLPITPASWNPKTPLVARLGEDGRTGIAGASLWRVMQRFFTQAADVVQDDQPVTAEKLRRANSHWKRQSCEPRADTRRRTDERAR